MERKQVLVLKDYLYDSNEVKISIKKGEKLFLVSKYNEEWCLVSRLESENHKSIGGEKSETNEVRNHLHSKLTGQSAVDDHFYVPFSHICFFEDDHDLNAKLQEVPLESESLQSAFGNNGKLSILNEHSNVPISSYISKMRNLANCDKTTNGDNLEGIYVEPFSLRVAPRTTRFPPDYENIYAFNNGHKTKTKLKPSPPSIDVAAETKLTRTLFDDWFEYEDSSKRKFYYNSVTKMSSWKPPRRMTNKVTFETESSTNGATSKVERKYSLDSQISLHHEHHYVQSDGEFGGCDSDKDIGDQWPHCRTKLRPGNGPNGSNSVYCLSDIGRERCFFTKEQATQTENEQKHSSDIIIPNVPDGWICFVDAQTNKVYFMNKVNHEKWFCKRDESGRIYFYEENGSGKLTGLPKFDDDSPERDTIRSQQNLKSISKLGLSKINIEPHKTFHCFALGEQGLQINSERNQKARSVALFSTTRNAAKDMIVFQEQFKHSSPFQNVSTIFPPPPNSLKMPDIIHSGTLNRTRTIVAGKGSKRKNWGTSYLVLTKHYLLFFKDQKAALATKDFKPEFILGLLSAAIDWCPNKSSRKNCFQVSTFDEQVLLQDENNDQSAKWFSTIQDCIIKISSLFNASSLVKPSISDSGEKAHCKLKRSRSTKQYRGPCEEMAMPGGGRNTLNGYATIGSTPMNDKKVKIRERLLHFLRKRPTMESLREKGIIKDENVFGCTLESLCARDRKPIPEFVKQCIEAIEFRDLKADGIYRACGNLSTVQKLRFEINQENYLGLWKEEDVHVLTGLLKMFFRNMPEPLFPCDRFGGLMEAIGISDKEAKFEAFCKLTKGLPLNNYFTLKYVLQHLLRITDYSQDNRMSIQNLAIVFGPTLIWPSNDLNNLVLDMMLQMQQSQVIEYLLLNFDSIFV